MKALPIFLILVSYGWTAGAAILYVGPAEQHKEIKEAIAAARPYDTLVVKAAHYLEHTIIINKPLYLLGEGRPTVDAQQQKVDLFIITSDSVVIEGFVLANVGTSYLNEFSAIKVRQSRYGRIRNNEILNCYFGIYLEYAQEYIIENNRIRGQAREEGSAGNAIHVWKAKGIEIAANTVTGHRDGIYLEFVDRSRINHNKSFQNLRYGLHFMFSNDDHYLHNEFRENGAGVAVMFSKNIRMEENLFTKNWGGASYGLLLKEISDGKILRNQFIRNTVGILAEGANRILIEQNKFTLNGTAIDMKGNCLDNQVLRNNFLTNTFELVTNTKYNTNLYDRNYWSGYAGYDLNRDGIGDVPYRPVSLFAKITEEIPAATLMLHSFFISLLEWSEHIFPDIIPEELIDQNPKMNEYPL